MVTGKTTAKEEPSRFSRFFGLKRVLIANAAVFIIVGWGFAGEYLRNHEMQGEIDRLKSQSEELEAKNLELAQLGQRFSTPEMVEREARTKLNLQKPGEQVVIVQVNPAEPAAAPAYQAPAATSNEQKASNAAKWWRFFFHRAP